MPKRAAGLTAAKVRTASPGAYVDGAGLMLLVQASGSAQWVLRYSFAGHRRDMGLGPARGVDAIPLAEARQKAAEARALIRAGADPVDARKAVAAARRAAEAPSDAKTFSFAVDKYLKANEAGWLNAKHRAQWAMTLREYAGPKVGMLPVADVTTTHVLSILQPIWNTKTETASRTRGRIEAVLDFARVSGWREGENPARWRGHLDKILPRRSKVAPVVHHAALPWQNIPAFIADVRARDAVAARALELVILTAARSGEVLGARWGEIDLDRAVWTVPDTRMKTKREHRVALSVAAVALLRSMLSLRASDDAAALVFPGQVETRPLSIMAMTMMLRRMGRPDITIHGFRSTFRVWAGETTGHPVEVVETALSHRTGNKVEQAYARGDLFTKRYKLMEDWAAFCGRPADAGKVVLIHGETATA